MDSQFTCEKIRTSNIALYPYPHTVVDNFLAFDDLVNLKSSLNYLMKNIEPRIYTSEHGNKIEYKLDDAILEPEYSPYENVMSFLASQECATAIKEAFKLDFQLEGDSTFDGGGFVISPPGSFLGYHADFNFSSKVGKYRVANILLYMNENYTGEFGGQLQLLHPDSLTVEKSVEPIENRAVIFLTTDITPLGVSRNLKHFSRRSFNAYFYTDKNPSDTSNSPHKTLWLN
jgi:hypothetical protein